VQARGPAFERIFDNADTAAGEVRQAAATLDQILQDQQDSIGTLIEEWTLTAGSVRRMSDQLNNLVAENREGLRDFTQTGLYEYTGLARGCPTYGGSDYAGDRGAGARPGALPAG
jgi:ABC-type transporter Mla subunit MlaD